LPKETAVLPRPSLLLATSLLAALPALAKEDTPRVATPAAIENCVSREWISFGSGDQSALLDADDHRVVSAALVRLYPVVERDGLAPPRLMLWQKRSGETLYVGLLPNPMKPSEACFTATFAAARFDMTLLLRRKYFSGALPRE
jgi:hypothetical protein